MVYTGKRGYPPTYTQAHAQGRSSILACDRGEGLSYAQQQHQFVSVLEEVMSVSIAELPNNRPRDPNINSVGAEFERTPPQDLIAEQSVLGGMLLSKDAIADVIEIIRDRDFYRPAHELIYDAIIDLYGRGEPADAVTVSAELTKRGDIARAGGAPYLHTLISSVPTAANAGYYAKIVREHAIMRRLVEAGTKIVQYGYTT